MAITEQVGTAVRAIADQQAEKAILTRWRLWTMAASAGIVIANINYAQPLLADMARSFLVSAEKIGWVAMLTQTGFASGMLLVAPFGDATDRRRMLTAICVLGAAALLGVAMAPSFVVIAVAGFAVGVGSIAAPLLMAFAAYLARPEEQGRAVGAIMGGLLIGILLARTLSGYVGQQLGWRAMYWIASVPMLLLALVLRLLLPRTQPRARLRYRQLMVSLGELIVDQPVLRDTALTGAMLFGAFHAFWTTLVFRLESPPYHYGSQAAGLFGLVGVTSALAASVAGHWADRRDARELLRFMILISLVAYVLLWLFSSYLWGIIVAVILLDAGVQGGSTCNHARYYRALPEAQNRAATIYLVSFFFGGSAGTALGAHAWQHFGYTGVCFTGMALVAIAGIKSLLPLAPARVREVADKSTAQTLE